jgi:Ser/Thr protein kinase RdoA (MazF antagonist)
MRREEVVDICNRAVLEKAANLFYTRKDDLKVFADYEGAANLVYQYEIDAQPLILRLSFRPERSIDQIRAELDFVEFLAEKGVRVSRPVLSRNRRLVETLRAHSLNFHIASFIKGKGMRVPDNGYRYREDAPIEEYFQNWGGILGQMHAASKRYQPPAEGLKRPDWFDLHQERLERINRLPDHLGIVRLRIQSTLEELSFLPRDRDSFGLIHGDFNDGNFTVDYTNGDIIAFDFDDSCYT